MSPTPGSRTGWSVRIATVFGIPIRIHFTFVLILLWVGLMSSGVGSTFAIRLVILLAVFACVVLHELGHALMARRFGVKTVEIVLYPIGGVARLRSMPKGKAELLIAIAGPAVNLLIVIALLPFALAAGAVALEPGSVTAPFLLLSKLILVNIILFAFNLIPAFPMDGGRILRAALSMRIPEDRATNIAASVGQVIAILFGTVGMFGIPGVMSPNPFLILIALFVFLGAGHEAAFVRRSVAIQGRSAREAMITRFEILAPQDSIGRAAELLLDTHQQDFPVVDAWGRVVGVLSRQDMLKGLADHGRSAAVLEVMDRDVPVVDPDTRMDEVLRKLQGDPVKPVLVLNDGHLVGMVTLENLAEFIEVARRS